MRFSKLLAFAVVATAITTTATLHAQLTWDPDGNQVSDGGDGTWSTSDSNWDDNGAAPNVVWTSGGDAVFGSKPDNSASLITLDGFFGVTVGNITLEGPAGSGAVNFNTNFDGFGMTVASGGASWELGGRTLHFLNDQGGDDATLSMNSGDTLIVTDSVGGGTFNTGERPQSATWSVTGATLDARDQVTVRGNPASVGQFGTVVMGDGTTYIHERNADQTYGISTNWELDGTVNFDNRFSRNVRLNGVVSDGASAGRLVISNFGGRALRLGNDANSFSGGVLIDSTNSRSELDFINVASAETSGFGAVPGAFDPDNITLRNGGELKMRGQTINSNRGIMLDGGGIIVLNSAPATYGGTISGTGGLQIGRTQGADGNVLVLTSNTHTYTGDTSIFQGRIQLGIDNAIPTDHILTIGGKGSSILLMEGFDQEIAGLRTAANNTRRVDNNGASVSTLTINTAEDTSHTYNGNFAGSNTVAIVKNGEGTQVFSRVGGFNTIPSAATVNAGRLRFNHPNLDDDPNSTGTPTAMVTAITVNAGGTLVIDAGNPTPNDGVGWDQEEIDVLMADATFNSGSFLGINGGAGDFTYTSNLSGNQGLYKIQTNTLTLTGTNTYAGPTFVENGTLMADSPSALPDTGLTVEGEEGPGYIGFNLDNWSEAQVDTRINAGTTTFDPNAGVELGLSSNASYSQDIPSTVTNFAVSGGSATLTLDGNNAYTGSTIIRSGTVNEDNANAIPDGTLLTLGEDTNDARLSTGGTDQTLSGLQSSSTGIVEISVGSLATRTLTIDVADGESYSYSGRLGGSTGLFDNNFNLVKNGTGTQRLSGANTYQGSTAINAGRLVIDQALDSAALNPGDVTIATGAEVILEGGGASEWSDGQVQDFLANQTFASGTTTFGIQANAEGFTFNGVVSGNKNFVKTGGQILTLTQAQTYTGSTHVESGTLALTAGGANPLPSGTVLSIGSPETGATVSFNGSDQTLGGLVSAGSGSGLRRITNGSATQSTITLNVAGGESYVYNHTIGIDGNADANNLALTKTGAGSQSILTAFYTGNTNIEAGTLLFNGGAANATGDITVSSGATVGGTGNVGGAITAQSGSSVAPGVAAGTMTLLSDLILNSGASLDFELNPEDQTVGGGVNDLINMNAATGLLTLNGSLNVEALTASSADFNSDSSVDGLDLAQWEDDYSLNGDSDADADGDSDGSDLLAWQRDFGAAGDFTSAQAGDRWRLINYDDANVTLTNNLSLGSVPALGGGLQFSIDDSVSGQIDLVITAPLASSTAVPEPTSLLLAALGGLGLLSRRVHARN